MLTEHRLELIALILAAAGLAELLIMPEGTQGIPAKFKQPHTGAAQSRRC